VQRAGGWAQGHGAAAWLLLLLRRLRLLLLRLLLRRLLLLRLLLLPLPLLVSCA
jgi:hypothetical protein